MTYIDVAKAIKGMAPAQRLKEAIVYLDGSQEHFPVLKLAVHADGELDGGVIATDHPILYVNNDRKSLEGEKEQEIS